MKQEFHLHVIEETPTLDLLVEASGLSRGELKQAMQKGAVWYTRNRHTQRLRRAKKDLKPGDSLHLYYDEQVLAEQVTDAELIADEGEYSVWYKPYGMRSQGSKWGDHTTIYRYAEQHLQPQRNAFLVHRLDRAASGLILLAHSKKMAALFSELFRQHRMDKRYKVVVHGRPQQAVMDMDLPLDGKPAHSRLTLLAYDEVSDSSLLEVKIESGRKHQIRRHLAELGLPVVGDRLYGQAGDSQDLQLVASRIAFTLPDEEQERHYALAEEKQPHLPAR